MHVKLAIKIAALLGVSFVLVTIGSAQQNALTALGVEEANAKQQMVWVVSSGRVPIGLAAKAFKTLDAAARAKIVQGVIAWAKTYTESAAFKADYAKQRESDKPKAQ